MAYKSQQSLPDELESVRRLRESQEGGPGSGPRKTQYAQHGGSPNNPNINPKSASAKNEKALRKGGEKGATYQTMLDSAVRKLGVSRSDVERVWAKMGRHQPGVTDHPLMKDKDEVYEIHPSGRVRKLKDE